VFGEGCGGWCGGSVVGVDVCTLARAVGNGGLWWCDGAGCNDLMVLAGKAPRRGGAKRWGARGGGKRRRCGDG